LRGKPHLSTRQYARIIHRWADPAGLDSSVYGTHSLRRMKPAQIYKKTGNLRAVQLLLGHTKLESTVGSRLMMRSPSRSRSNFIPAQGCGPTNPRAAAHPRSRFTSCYVHPKTSAGWAELGGLRPSPTSRRNG
jgi:hypothetical protein